MAPAAQGWPYPELVLAPMAGGPSTVELATSVCNAGGLGFLAAGYLTVDAMVTQVDAGRMSLWAGTRHSAARSCPAAEIVQEMRPFGASRAHPE